MKNPFALEGKKILITGASSGIGRETARAVSQLGGTAVLVARNEGRLSHTLESLDGFGHSLYVANLAELDCLEVLVKKIVTEQGKLDGIAYCAGIGSTFPLKMTKPTRMLDVMRVNVFAFVELSRLVANKKYRNDKASFVGVSSLSSRRGESGMTAYCSSKAAMDGAVRAMAHELAPDVRVNTVLPGWINTEMLQRVTEENGTKRLDQETEVMQYMGVGEPTDVAYAICYLLSDAARFVTGVSMPVDGGYFS